MGYRIEAAKTNRSSCRECGMVIEKGHMRFGKNGQPSRWFHLGCASAGAPRSFKAFAEEAAEYISQGDGAANQIRESDFSRDVELEKLLEVDPDDAAARQVFADQLLERGDPWGELISLERGGHEKEARALLKKYRDDLMGGLAPKFFEWEGGFVTAVTLEGKKPQALIAQLEKLVSLRVVVTAGRLALPIVADQALMERVSELAPKAMTELFTWYSPALDYLSIAWLRSLSMFVPANPKVAEGFLSARDLPSLRRLSMFGNSNALPIAFLDALINSPLVEQLEELRLFQGALDQAGRNFMLDNKSKLSHLSKRDW